MANAKNPRRKNVLAPAKASGRSRVTNGKEYLPNVDGRSVLARRMRDVASQVAADLGGVERLSEAKRQLIRRFAGAAALAEQLEAQVANGKTIDINEHATLTSSLVRIASRIGLGRAMKRVPSLDEYLASKEMETDDA